MSDIRLKHEGWLVVLDGEKALFMRNEGDEKFPNLAVFREFEQENPPTHEQGTDQPGRMPDGANVHKSAVQETDWHRLEKERFAKDIADRLYKHAHAGRIKELVLVASPMVLGEVRKEMHEAVRDRVVAEVDKDLTNHPVHEIEKLVLHSDA